MINVSRLYCGLSGKSDHLRYSARNDFGPVMVFNCTAKCNLSCMHCYSQSGCDSIKDELSGSEAKRLFDEFVRINCPVVLFSGGEPLMRSDIFELLSYAGKIGLKTVLSSNGTLIDPEKARKLSEVNIGYVGVSIDGVENFHDRFRGRSGSFKLAMEGIGNCHNAGLKTGLRFTMTADNVSQIPDVFGIAKKAGIRRICFYHLISAGRARELKDNVLSTRQVRSAVDTILKKTDEYISAGFLDEVLTVGNHADGPYLLVKMTEEGRPNSGEAAELLRIAGGNKTGEKIGAVDWDGNVYADQFWRNFVIGNIKDKSFAEIWQDSSQTLLSRLRNKNKFADKRCLSCKWFDLCRGNYRFLGDDIDNWVNDPACYLSDDEIA